MALMAQWQLQCHYQATERRAAKRQRALMQQRDILHYGKAKTTAGLTGLMPVAAHPIKTFKHARIFLCSYSRARILDQ